MLWSRPERRHCSLAYVLTSWLQPFWGTALIMAYSPLTLYAATGSPGRLTDSGDHIQVGKGRLHHDDIRPFFFIQEHLPDPFPAVVIIHLITAPVCQRKALTLPRPEGAA